MVAVQHGKLDWEVALHWLPLTPGKARSLLHCLNKLGCPFFIGILQCPSHPFAACPLWAICHGHETIHEGTKANGPAILLGGCVFCSYDGSIRCFSWLDVPPPPQTWTDPFSLLFKNWLLSLRNREMSAQLLYFLMWLMFRERFCCSLHPSSLYTD